MKPISFSGLPFENSELTVGKMMAGMVVLFVYFIPTILSWNKKNSRYLAVFNLLMAWTVFGWFVSFVWALNINRQHGRILIEEKKKKKEAKKIQKNKLKNKTLSE